MKYNRQIADDSSQRQKSNAGAEGFAKMCEAIRSFSIGTLTTRDDESSAESDDGFPLFDNLALANMCDNSSQSYQKKLIQLARKILNTVERLQQIKPSSKVISKKTSKKKLLFKINHLDAARKIIKGETDSFD